MGQTFSAVTQETMRLASRDVCDDLTWSNTWANRSTLSVPEQLELLERKQRTENKDAYSLSNASAAEDRLWAGISRISIVGQRYQEEKKETKVNVVMPLYPEPAAIDEHHHQQQQQQQQQEEEERKNESETRESRRRGAGNVLTKRGHRRRRSSKEVVFVDRVVVFQLKENDTRWSLDSDNDSDDSV